jgi:predicted ribosome quality control (RQC) complex YloA/Tae2 family protein
MDNIILEALVDEWNQSLPGAGVAKIYYYTDDGYYIALFNNSARIFHFAVSGPQIGCRLLRDRPNQSSDTSRLMLLMRKYIEGAYIKGFSKPPYERILEIKLVKSREGIQIAYLLVLEFTGKTGNAYLLAEDGKILALEHPVKNANRILDLNLFYSPPVPPCTVNLDNVSKEDLQRFSDEAAKTDSRLETLLASSIFGLGSILAGELALGLRKSIQYAWNSIVEIRRKRREKDYSPGLYLPSEDLSVKSSKSFFHVMTPLEQAKGLRLVNYNSASSCLSAAHIEFQNRYKLTSLKNRLTDRLSKEKKSTETLIKNLQHDISRFSNPEVYKKWGELLVANLGTAVKNGETVELPDLYDPMQQKVQIKIEPSLSLQANADRFFNLYRKSKRGKEMVEKKIVHASEKLKIAEGFERRISSSSVTDLEEIEKEMFDYGFLKLSESRGGLHKQAARVPFRIFVSSDGMEILVGKKASDNDVLSFKYARDLDFWLHCAGSAGSHVVIRNPGKLGKCPSATLEEAASLAAFFSKQRSNSKVQVNYSQKKFVRKIKGAPPGQVKLLSFSSLLVKPEIPPGVTGGEEESS